MNSIRQNASPVESWGVPAITLDAALSGIARIRLVKIDIEGAELQALRGFVQVMRGPDAPDVLCEVTDPFLKQLGGSALELLELMRQSGYQSYSFDKQRFRQVSSRDVASIPQLNLVFTKHAAQLLTP